MTHPRLTLAVILDDAGYKPLAVRVNDGETPELVLASLVAERTECAVAIEIIESYLAGQAAA